LQQNLTPIDSVYPTSYAKVKLPDGVTSVDKDGTERTDMRVAWRQYCDIAVPVLSSLPSQAWAFCWSTQARLPYRWDSSLRVIW